MERHGPDAARVDVIVVSYNSGATLRGCVAPLVDAPGVDVIVVDNASPEPPAEALAGLGVRLVRSPRNGGFSYGCNLGVAEGTAPYVLLLNPDARIEPADLDRLAAVLDADPTVAVAAPRILEPDGSTAPSLRRFPRLTLTLAQSLMAHRLFPGLDELVTERATYLRPGSPDWVSGACMLIRRDALAAVGGMDERFFLYCEDADICKRLRDRGHTVRYEPAAVATHIGGQSGSRSALRPILAASRVAYARKHSGRVAAALERGAIALGELVHALVHVLRPARARGHLEALAVVARRPRPKEAA
jgi:N-acetylglucosaminyl-diphospho-decaprenol L-rhamnosyltransferase